jgi:hypothetical protein
VLKIKTVPASMELSVSSDKRMEKEALIMDSGLKKVSSSGSHLRERMSLNISSVV